MAYSELIKNFNRIRAYMQEFYIYGFKSRDEYTGKSARSYDDERRRLESWLNDYMRFRQTPNGKNVFISVDSRSCQHNPLYKAWKAKSFTDGDITLHFIIFDLLHSPDVCLTSRQITAQIDEYLSQFANPKMFDESTVRKKLKEYCTEGLLITEKEGKSVFYRRSAEQFLPDMNVLDYFSEIFPCGVIGSFLLDKGQSHKSHFLFKHHYITATMDSEILCSLFTAIRNQCSITLKSINGNKNRMTENRVVPLKIMISVQSGRQYLVAYELHFQRMISFRIDRLIDVKLNEVSDCFEQLQVRFQKMLPSMWGVQMPLQENAPLEHVEFTICYSENEKHIKNRLEREKRCGTVEHLDKNTSKFSADVFDSAEMIPWIRTFICRIREIQFSNKKLEQQFKADLREMMELYGLEGE